MSQLSNGSHCHFLLKETALGMAHEVYDAIMQDNARFAQWKEQCPDLTPGLAEDKFCEALWPHLLEAARTTLAGMLAGSYPEELKQRIHDALVKDNVLREGRARAIARQIN